MWIPAASRSWPTIPAPAPPKPSVATLRSPSQLVAREVIHADARVGYGIVLTWGQAPGGYLLIGETLVVFVPKSAVTPFISGSGTFAELLAQWRGRRVFDGQTEA